MSATTHPRQRLPLIDVAPLFDPDGERTACLRTAAEIDQACRDLGFFRITGHALTPGTLDRLDRSARAFFALDHVRKEAIAMRHGRHAWRGWFPLGGELTSGRPDRKEGLYFGVEHGPDHPRVLARTPLHGANQFPDEPADLRDAVHDALHAFTATARAVLRGLALGLGLPAAWFDDHLTGDPTVLFRIFRYPPDEQAGWDEEGWGVGEHTDYGLLTLLAQDGNDGLQVRTRQGWIDVPPDRDVLVCNLGDMLERLTGGRYRSTPHRVRNATTHDRLSFPCFVDPAWDAEVTPLPLSADAGPSPRRWDDADVMAWEGTYGEYLTAKVSRVFPELFGSIPHVDPVI